MKTHTIISVILVLIANLLILLSNSCRDWDVGPDPPPEPPEYTNWKFTTIDIETISGNTAKLSWNGYYSSRSFSTDSFEIFRRVDSEDYVRISTLDFSIRSFVDKRLNTMEHDYTYFVDAVTDSLRFSSPQVNYNFACGYDIYTDNRDGSVYKTIDVNGRCWMAENLKFMPGVYPPADFDMDSARYYVYGYNDYNIIEARAHPNFQTYGVLYNFTALQDACPDEDGWRLANSNDWVSLIDTLGGGNLAGGALKETDTVHWKSPNTGATDTFGFTALPGGKLYSSGVFSDIGEAANFWGENKTAFHIFYNATGIFNSQNTTTQVNSIRCVRDLD